MKSIKPFLLLSMTFIFINLNAKSNSMDAVKSLFDSNEYVATDINEPSNCNSFMVLYDLNVFQEVKSIKIADLVANPKKYEGKYVQISGTCSKVNANILGKNWIHLQDGSKDDYDLVVTSTDLVKEGDTVTMKALVSLNKDIGAGYVYDIILEEGTVVKD